MHLRHPALGWLLVSCVFALAGCADAGPQPSAAGAKFLTASEPPGAQEVAAARSKVQTDDEVVVVGRIGGARDPFVGGRAAFTLVDRSLKACSDIPGDTCPTPWDYCCELKDLPQRQVLVQVVDEAGQPVRAGARELLGVRELETLVVQGKARRDEAGNVTILASRVFVQR